MCDDDDVRYTSIEAFRAAFYPQFAWLMELDPGDLWEWPEFEDEIMAECEEERARAAADKEEGSWRVALAAEWSAGRAGGPGGNRR